MDNSVSGVHNGLRTVLFDLDGTLVDTAPDLVLALNRVVVEAGVPPLAEAAVRPTISLGGQAMVSFALGLTPDDPNFESLYRRFLAVYAQNLCVSSALFPGMAAVLEALEAGSMGWGVVTNKSQRFTDPLMAALNLTARAACIISGDTTPKRKPNPEPLLLACEQAGSEPGECVYVGDAERDIEAGRAAGMRTIVARFGYIPSDQNPDTWGADAIITTPAGLLDWIEAQQAAV